MVPIELPLKPSEAAALADVVFQFAENRPLNDELRNRLNGRLLALEFTSIAPFMGSLQKDPVHSSAYYIAVDAISESGPNPLLLRTALASAPANALFPDPILIGRMRPGGEREIVVDAIPFASTDCRNIRTFAAQIDSTFLPRPQAAQSAITLAIAQPETIVPAAFDAFRAINHKYSANLASFSTVDRASLDRVYCTCLWAAIRAGWRGGYNLGLDGLVLRGGLEAVKQTIEEASGYTRFTIDPSPLFQQSGDGNHKFGKALLATEEIFGFIQKTKSEQASWKHFDFELSLAGSQTPTTPDDLAYCLQSLRARGRAAQQILPNLGNSEDQPSRIAELAAVARQFNATLSFDHPAGAPEQILQQIGRATGGRFNLRTSPGAIGARREITEHIVSLASELRA